MKHASGKAATFVFCKCERQFGRTFGSQLKLSALRLLVVQIILQLIFQPIAFAFTVRTNVNLKWQTLTENHPVPSLLRAGSIVDIPDEFIVNGKDGRANAELTLNNWLRNAGQVGERSADRAGGQLMKAPAFIDYYYPVKIISAAPGSTIATYHGKTYFLALRMLTRTSQGKLQTTNDSHPQQTETRAAADGETEANANCLDGRCNRRNENISPRLVQFLRDMKPALDQAQKNVGLNRRRTTTDYKTLRQQFANSCGFSLDSFMPILKEHAASHGISPRIMVAMMVQESSGRCFATGRNATSTDHGLFGLNSRSTRIHRCSEYEIEQIRSSSAERLERGPRCLENPVVNLDASIENLQSKIEALTRPYFAGKEQTEGFDERLLLDAKGDYTPFAWRLAISAYNGGEKWVMHAKTDLETFNRVNGTHLNPYEWKDLRIFYLRGFLSDNRELQYFGENRSKDRTSSALVNLAYTENIVP
jgi:Transglycosylase SLT domain